MFRITFKENGVKVNTKFYQSRLTYKRWIKIHAEAKLYDIVGYQYIKNKWEVIDIYELK